MTQPLFTIDGNPGTPTVGNVYLINHSRKGKFHARVKSVSDVWAEVEIIEGYAAAALPENEREEGESLSVRASLCRFETVPQFETVAPFEVYGG